MEKALSLKNLRNLLAASILLIIFLNPLFCQAANLGDAFGDNSPLKQAAGDKGAGYNTGDAVSVDTMISLIITTILSFIGVLFLVLAIYGGFIWMMARGNEQEVDKAKQIIQNSVIGIIIVVAAYAISWYVINALGSTTLK